MSYHCRHVKPSKHGRQEIVTLMLAYYNAIFVSKIKHDMSLLILTVTVKIYKSNQEVLFSISHNVRLSLLSYKLRLCYNNFSWKKNPNLDYQTLLPSLKTAILHNNFTLTNISFIESSYICTGNKSSPSKTVGKLKGLHACELGN